MEATTMPEATDITTSEPVGYGDLASEFLSLRIGEEIPALSVRGIRKVTSPQRQDNLPGADFRYHLISDEGKVLTVSSWTLWKAIRTALQKAGSIHVTLRLIHHARQNYEVSVVR